MDRTGAIKTAPSIAPPRWLAAIVAASGLLACGHANACSGCRPQVLSLVFDDAFPVRLFAVVAPLVLSVAIVCVLGRPRRGTS